MRIHLSILLLVLAQPVFADAYKCKSSTGQTVITDKPCDVIGHGYLKSAKSDVTDSNSVARAQADLQRQKSWLDGRDEMHRDDAVLAQQKAAAVDRSYPAEQPQKLKSESIWDKSWGCGNRSCPSTVTSSGRR